MTKPRSRRPLPAGDSFYTPGAGRARHSLERSSARPLAYLHQLPGWLPPILLLALLIVGLAVPGWIGAASLVVLALLLGWLGFLSWPSLTVGGRLLRMAAAACVLAIAVVQALR